MLVFFDIDDTLVDHYRAFRLATTELHRRVDSQIAKETFLSHWADVHRQYFGRYLAGELSYQEQSRARIRAAVDPRLRDEQADRLFAVYLDAYEAVWSLFPDVEACLGSLAQHRLGVISNGQRSQQVKKLERTGIIDKFDCILISEECGHSKPGAEIFRHACALAGEPAERAIYVGDRYDVDAVGARQAGLAGVWLDRRGNASAEHKPPIVGSLCELPWTVDSIERMLRNPAG